MRIGARSWPRGHSGSAAPRLQDGSSTAVTSTTSAGLPAEVQRSGPDGQGNTITESNLYTYITSGVNAGLLASVVLRRQVNGGTWTVVRQTNYTYYDGTQSYGNAGDLMLATVEDGAGNVLDTSYYRYYTGEAGGYVHGLKYYFSSQSYARLAAAYSDPQSATDAQVAGFADAAYQYDAAHRVSQVTLQGAGPDSAGGLGTYQYVYFPNSDNAQGYNSWLYETQEIAPDGSTTTVYANDVGETMLEVFTDAASGQSWDNFYVYNGSGQQLLHAAPSAVTGYSDSYADLLNNQSGNYQYLSDNSGLIELTDYYASTTATETTPGGVATYVQDTKIEQGELGTPILQSTLQYYAHNTGTSMVYPVATQTQYRNTDGSGAQSTTNTYTWYSGTAQIQSLTVTAPVVTAAENGPGTADTSVTFYDTDGHVAWQKDADGFITYTAYDEATGGVTETIIDVNTANTGDFQDLPTGWVTPSNGGLNLVTTNTLDALGRPTKTVSPAGNVTYTVYLDSQHETRAYPGWNSNTGLPTGPTEVERTDYPGSYQETLTMTATPHLTNGVPDGSEAIGNVQTLSRGYVSDGGQLVRQDDYFNLSGVTYSTAAYLGTQNANFYTTLFGFDVDGRQDRVQHPTGTIDRTVYDNLSRQVGLWVGTDDTPASGTWSPTNNTSPANMVQTVGYQYDNGGVGDGNLTQETDIPGGTQANRVTQFWFDWRDRQVASKQGVQQSEDTTTHRPIVFNDYDNLDEVVAASQYDGDGVTITVSTGVPVKPSASLLRAYQTSSFDEQGRVFLAQVYEVNQSTGAVSQYSLNTNTYYNHRGLDIEVSQPGGIVTKTAYDGAGRPTVDYTTDGAGGTGWTAAGNVSGDHVLQQDETQYDGDDNVIEEIDRQRFHNETAAGALGNATTAPKARVSYVTHYYDPADRDTADVDVGTNGGSAYTRPATVPAGSATVLVTGTTYGPAGFVQDVIDPRGLDTRTSSDALGRTTQTIEDYTDGIPTNETNKTTNMTYDGDGNTLTLQAVEPGGASETTQWIYGVSTATGSTVNSNDMLATVEYPDPTSGAASTSYEEQFSVDAFGENLTYADRAGNVHAYSRDVLGRLTADTITTLAAGFDNAVLQIGTTYNALGNVYQVTTYNAASGGSIVNQVQDVYNGLGQLTQQYQSHSGAVVPGTTPSVQYAYTEMSGGQNNSRLVSMTYPNGRVLNYNYNAGLDSTISRLSSISDTSATLESELYLGLNTIVERDHPQDGVNLTYISQTGSTGDAGDQ